MKPLNQFILNTRVRYSANAILARLLGCYWIRIDLEVLLYHRYVEEEQLQEEVVLFFGMPWMPASSLCCDLCQSKLMFIHT